MVERILVEIGEATVIATGAWPAWSRRTQSTWPTSNRG